MKVNKCKQGSAAVLSALDIAMTQSKRTDKPIMSDYKVLPIKELR